MNTEVPARRIVYVVSDELVKFSSLLPSNRNRSLLVHTLISKLGLFSPIIDGHKSPLSPVRPRLATLSELLLYHDRDYIDFVLDPQNSSVDNALSGHSEYGIEDDCPPFSGLPRYIQLIAGATITAAASLKNGEAEVAICWDGGRHHAQKSSASGFCYVADCILAILTLKKPQRASGGGVIKPRIMYLDLDLHFSDAVSHAFSVSSSKAIPQVLTLSVHHASAGFFPVSPLSGLPAISSSNFDPFTLSLPLRQGASSRTFSRIWPMVEKVKDAFNPDYVVLQCGVDGLALDPCATWNWSVGIEPGDMGWCVRRVLNDWGCKALLLGGGGYNSTNAARAWAHLTSIAIGKALPLDTPIPDHAVFPLYGPSFTLDVPAGNMRDENNEEYIDSIERCFSVVVDRIRTRMELANK